ncbi:MAG TPA: hypothetical protein VN914_04105 [Polyangia bacterium]|nr:hypothetical protein [Polyangia bacterium]
MAKRIVFALVLALSLALFAWTLRRFGRLIASGRPDKRLDHPGARLWSVLTTFLGQKTVLEAGTPIPAARWPRFVKWLGSRYHVVIFWGFLIITVGTTELLVQGLFPTFSLAMILGPTVADGLNTVIEWMTVAVLAMLAFAVFRRTVLQPRLIPMSRDAAAILGAIATLMVSYFGMHAFGIQTGALPDGFPISSALADWLPAGAAAPVLAEVAYWVHVVTLLAFLNYLLYSKHSHIVASLPNIYFRDLGQKGVLPKLNLEADDISQTGVVSDYKDFTWKHLLDSFACTECAR